MTYMSRERGTRTSAAREAAVGWGLTTPALAVFAGTTWKNPSMCRVTFGRRHGPTRQLPLF
jgi:hypothetical protein